METPDKWIVVAIGNDPNPLYKVFGSWYGGYLGADSWRMNSGIARVEEDETHINFYGYSGSHYQCVKGTYGTNMFSQGVLNNIMELAIKNNSSVTVMPEDTDWVNLIK